MKIQNVGTDWPHLSGRTQFAEDVKNAYRKILGRGLASKYEVNQEKLARFFPGTARHLARMSSDDVPQVLMVRVSGTWTAAMIWRGEVAKAHIFDQGGLLLTGTCTESGRFNWSIL